MEAYDQITATHYAAFRPALHEVILSRCLEGRFGYALDPGCGTGSSSIPLTHFCDRVVGIDPSQEMLSQAIFHPQISYSLFNGMDLEFDDDLFDLVTFAGSLVYAKSQRILDETIRVIKPSGTILVYDFEILIDAVFERLGISRSSQATLYNHRENFDGLRQDGIELINSTTEQISFPIQADNLAHLLLSDSHDYAVLLDHIGKDQLFNKLVSMLSTAKDLDQVSANLFYSLYLQRNT